MSCKPLVPGLPESRVLAGAIEAFALFGVDAERQNTGGFTNPRGQYVACGRPGNSDLRGVLPIHFGSAAGKSWACECKRGGYRPLKSHAQFWLQVSRLQEFNAAGGYGWWINDPAQVAHVLTRIKQGWRVEIDERGYPFLVSPEETSCASL